MARLGVPMGGVGENDARDERQSWSPQAGEQDSKKGNRVGALTNIRAVPTMTLRPWPRTQPGHFFEVNVNG